MDLSLLPTKIKNDEDGQQTSDEGSQGEAKGEGSQSHQDGHDRSHGRTTRNPENIGIGQRISQEGLKDGTGYRKTCSHQTCQESPRYPEGENDRFLGLRACSFHTQNRLKEDREGAMGFHLHAAHHNGEDRDKDQDETEKS